MNSLKVSRLEILIIIPEMLIIQAFEKLRQYIHTHATVFSK